MKSNRLLLLIAIVFLPLMYGCPDKKTVLTSVNSDGSCSRTIGTFDPRSFKGIDSIIQKIRIPIDDSWELVNINDSVAELRKDFESIEALNVLYDTDQSMLKMYSRGVYMDKKFRWFHTVFDYREVYEGLLTEIPITNYISEEEYEVFMADDASSHSLLGSLDPKAQKSLIDNIEERFGLWLHDNIYSRLYDDIMQISDSLGISKISGSKAKALKDTIKHKIDQEGKYLITFDDDDTTPTDIALLIGAELRLDSVSISILSKTVDSLMLDKKYEDWLLANVYGGNENQVILPGVLLGTNAEFIRGDTLIWNVNSIKHMGRDFVMHAESQTTNVWAYLVSAIILIVALIIPFLSRKKGKLPGTQHPS